MTELGAHVETGFNKSASFEDRHRVWRRGLHQSLDTPNSGQTGRFLACAIAAVSDVGPAKRRCWCGFEPKALLCSEPLPLVEPSWATLTWALGGGGGWWEAGKLLLGFPPWTAGSRDGMARVATRPPDRLSDMGRRASPPAATAVSEVCWAWRGADAGGAIPRTLASAAAIIAAIFLPRLE